VFDGTGAAPIADATIVIRDGRIVAVGPADKIAIPADADVRDLAGHSVTPGFVMVHEHLFYPVAPRAYGAMFDTFPKLYLAGGATTVRTGGSVSPFADLNTRRDIAEGRAIGPDLDVTAPFLNGPALFAPQVHRIQDAAQAREMVRHWDALGVTSYKGYMHLTREQLAAIVEEAHARRHKVTAHLCSVTYAEAAAMGIDNLEHGFLASTDFVADKAPDVCPPGPAMQASLDALAVDDPRMDALQKRLIERKVAITSTLTVFETFAPGRPLASPAGLELLVPELREQYVARWSAINAQKSNVWGRLLPKGMAWEKRFADAGGLLLAGTDPTGYGGVIPGYSNVRQVELLEEAGFTRAQALRIATLNGAVYLGRDRDIGSIAPGKRADLVLYEGKISQDPQALRKIVWTMKAGVAYDSRRILASLKGKVGFQ
jgi:imidazolonepropionase-like amidohydrolase